MSNPNKDVYHYTSINACLSIIRDRRILIPPIKDSLLKENKDFLRGPYLFPLMLSLKPNIDTNIMIIRYKSLVVPLINSSYVFCTTTSYYNEYHWGKYAGEYGCCIELSNQALNQHSKFLYQCEVYYNDNAFKNALVEEFLLYCLENRMSECPNIAIEGFMKAVSFSKYPDDAPDNEYRFWYGDLANFNKEVPTRKASSAYGSYLILPIDPEKDIQAIYFKSNLKRLEFLNKIEGNHKIWGERSIILS